MSTALPQVDAAGFARVYERHHQALYRYCRSILRHEQDAQDALQSAMMRAFVALQSERRELELRPWLFRIAHNESINILRRRSHAGVLDETLGDVGTLEDCVADRETLRLLRRDLLDLPERQRSALVLRELNGLGHEEIAAVLGTTPAAVKQAIFEGRSALLRCREGRDAACAEIQRLLSDGDGRILRSRPVRAHLRACAGCREFRGALAHRPRELAALLPPLPGGTALALLRGLFEGPAATVAAGGITSGLAAKAAIVVAIAGGGGAVALHSEAASPQRAVAAPHHAAAPGPAHEVSSTVATGSADHIRRAAPAPSPPPASAPSPPPRASAPASRRASAPAPGRTTHAAAAATLPADQAASGATGAAPHGKVKKSTAAPKVPPGHAKAPKTPPGQAKKHPAAAAQPAAPKPPPPGQAKKHPAAVAPQPAAPKPPPPGQAKKHLAPAAPQPAAPEPSPGEVADAAAPPPVDTGEPVASPLGAHAGHAHG
jgi:RNA polymerase sigma factor (sigma-70 family)